MLFQLWFNVEYFSQSTAGHLSVVHIHRQLHTWRKRLQHSPDLLSFIEDGSLVITVPQYGTLIT